MTKEKILYQPKPYDEKLTLATGRGGRKIVGVVWTLYPSHEFVEEIIRGNEEMLEKKEVGQAESQQNAGAPELWRFHEPGEIRAAWASRVEKGGRNKGGFPSRAISRQLGSGEIRATFPRAGEIRAASREK
jgi:hypothetical protein